MKSGRRKILHETVELNITAFMNLMVILVPFLLITTVFSRLTVLELNLPALDAKTQQQERVDLQLQLLVRPDELEIRDANLGVIKRFQLTDNINWKPITDVLLDIKRRFPESTTVTLLMDRRVSYKRLIEVMDHVRAAEVVNVAALEEVELFPDISIGDAPATDASASQSEPAPSVKEGT